MTHVLVLAKAPRDGFVKTRLARDVGAQKATQLYRQVGRRVVAQLEPLPLTIWFDPPDAREEMQDWLGDREYRAQPAGDLGARLVAAFTEHFKRHVSPAVAVGMDAPGVDVGLITRAFEELEHTDVVLGPARDGGYYLIGLSKMTSVVFEDVPWSSPAVYAETIMRCTRAGLRVTSLEILADMDTMADAKELGLWPLDQIQE